MKRIFFTLIILTILKILPAQVPTYLDAFRIAGPNNDVGKKIGIDSAGNIYVSGYFGVGCDFDPSSVTSTMSPGGNMDIFLAKYTPSGSLLWRTDINGSNEFLFDMKTDPAGNSYLTGSYSGSLTAFGQGNLMGINSRGMDDGFIVKYNSSGQVMLLQTFGDAQNDRISSVVMETNGDYYIGGYYQSAQVDVDPGPGQILLTNNTLNGIYNNPFIAKYDSAGNYQWAISLKNSVSGVITALRKDSAGRLVAGGNCTGTITVDSSGTTLNAVAGVADAVILRYFPSGNYDAGWSFGGSGVENLTNLITTENDIVSTGTFMTITDLDPGTGNHMVASSGGQEIFVSKINENGIFQWGGNIKSPGHDLSCGLTVNAAGDVYVSGFILDSASFNLTTGASKVMGISQEDAFVAKYSSGGALITAMVVGGLGTDNSLDIVHSGAGEFLITGVYTDNPAYLNPATPFQTTLLNAGMNDAYIARYSDNLVTAGIKHINADEIKLYPVPANDILNIELKSSGNYTLQVMDMSGRIAIDKEATFSSSTQIDIHTLESGVYFLMVKNDNAEPINCRFIKQ